MLEDLAYKVCHDLHPGYLLGSFSIMFSLLRLICRLAMLPTYCVSKTSALPMVVLPGVYFYPIFT